MAPRQDRGRRADAANRHRPLTAGDLLAGAPLHVLGRAVLALDEVDSTNAFLLRCAGELPDGTIATAEYQTAGRGRLGRSWAAPRGSSVLLSLLLRTPADAPLLTHATLLGAVAACEAAEGVTPLRVGVRWPNDVIVGRKKLGGVLAESRPLPAVDNDPADQRALVLGIGLNCLQQAGHLASGDLAGRATSLELELRDPVDRAAIARALVTRLDAHLANCRENEKEWRKLAALWRERCEDIGSLVTLEHDGGTYRGTVLEVEDDGGLVVELERGGRRRFGPATTTRAW